MAASKVGGLQYTSVDMANAMQYANQRAKLRKLLFLSKQSLHTASWLDYEIRPANPTTDYYFPASFADKAVMVDVKFTEQACNKVNCNVRKSNDICKFNDETQTFRVGESRNFDFACQPSCYNLTKVAVYDDDGTMKPQSHRVEWVEKFNACVFVPETATFMEMPRFRSKETYARRLNDLALGFDLARDRDPAYGVSGRVYKFNNYYCDVYHKHYDPKDEKCTETFWETIGNAIIGENIINLTKDGIQLVENGTILPTVTNLPPLPDVPSSLVLEQWRKDYNQNFIAPKVDVGLAELGKCPIIIQHNARVSDKEEYNSATATPQEIIANMYENTHLKVSHITKCVPTLRRREMDKELLLPSQPTRSKRETKQGATSDNEEVPAPNKIWETTRQLINSLLNMFLDPDFYRDLAINQAWNILFGSLKQSISHMSERFIPMLLKSMVSQTSKLMMSEVMKGAIIGTLTNTVMTFTLKMASQTMLMLAKLLTELVSVVGIILAVVQILDIIPMFWDPLGFRSAFNKEVIEQLNFNGELALRRQLSMREPIMTFEILCFLMLSKEDVLALNLEMFTDIYEYLDSLVVNSEGAQIDKGEALDPKTQPDNFATVVLAKRSLYTTDEFTRYEQDHVQRMEFWKKHSQNTLLILGAAFVFFAVIQVWFAALLMFIAILVVIFLGYLNATVNVNKYLEPSKLSFLFE